MAMKKNIGNIIIVVSLILLIILIVNTLFLTNILTRFKSPAVEKPAKIQIISVLDENCAECQDLTSIIDSIKKKNVEVAKENRLDMASEEAKKLIEEYEIIKIPTIIVAGDIDNLKLPNFNKFEKKGVIPALLFSDIKAPFVDADTGNIKGIVSLTVVADKNCDKCINLSLIAPQLKQDGVFIGAETIVQFDGDDGKKLIEKYKLERVPSMILSPDIILYPGADELLKGAGNLTEDGSFVIEAFMPPYIDAKTKELKGLVDLLYLVDNSCDECYNASVHGLIVKSRGIEVSKEETFDISSNKGKELVSKYKIEGIPTIILSKETSAYTQFNKVWEGVGTIEDDGSYVFRSVDVMAAPYKNLTTGEIIKPK